MIGSLRLPRRLTRDRGDDFRAAGERVSVIAEDKSVCEERVALVTVCARAPNLLVGQPSDKEGLTQLSILFLGFAFFPCSPLIVPLLPPSHARTSVRSSKGAFPLAGLLRLVLFVTQERDEAGRRRDARGKGDWMRG